MFSADSPVAPPARLRFIGISPGTPEWLAVRERNVFNATAVVELLGLGYNSGPDAWRFHHLGIKKPITAFAQQLFDIGHRREHEMLVRLLPRYPHGLLDNLGTICAPDGEDLWATPDAIAFTEDPDSVEVIECKTTTSPNIFWTAPQLGHVAQLCIQTRVVGPACKTACLVYHLNNGDEADKIFYMDNTNTAKLLAGRMYEQARFLHSLAKSSDPGAEKRFLKERLRVKDEMTDRMSQLIVKEFRLLAR